MLRQALRALASRLRPQALFEQGDGFTIGCSHGAVLLPSEAQDTSTALTIADQRMYAAKRVGRVSAAQQSKDVLLSAVAERNRDLGAHGRDVAELAAAVATAFSLPLDEVEMIRHAAELHDVGKVAVPDAILDKPAALDERRVGVDPRAHAGRREDHRGRARSRARGQARPLEPRELRRDRLPRWARAPGDTARLADHRGLRRVRRDDDRPALP